MTIYKYAKVRTHTRGRLTTHTQTAHLSTVVVAKQKLEENFELTDYFIFLFLFYFELIDYFISYLSPQTCW